MGSETSHVVRDIYYGHKAWGSHIFGNYMGSITSALGRSWAKRRWGSSFKLVHFACGAISSSYRSALKWIERVRVPMWRVVNSEPRSLLQRQPRLRLIALPTLSLPRSTWLVTLASLALSLSRSLEL